MSNEEKRTIHFKLGYDEINLTTGEKKSRCGECAHGNHQACEGLCGCDDVFHRRN